MTKQGIFCQILNEPLNVEKDLNFLQSCKKSGHTVRKLYDSKMLSHPMWALSPKDSARELNFRLKWKKSLWERSQLQIPQLF